jgi:glycosyltransferase involved in cell wall biosynthesis
MKSPMPEATSSTLCKNGGTIVAGPRRGPTAARHHSGVSVRALQAPRVSVLLPVWNGEAFLEQAMESVLQQTFSSFELILIDDGSTDRTAAIAEEFAFRDTRVRVLRRRHEGFSATLNAGIAAARGEYVARMDADDISVPDRLQKQVAYLDVHPACVAVGAWIEVVNEAGRHVGLKTLVTTHDEISAALLRGVSPMAHPTVVARRDTLRAVGGYDARCYPSEDLDLWFRLGESGELANLGEALLKHRRHKAAIGVREREKMKAMAVAICNDARIKRGLRPRRGTHILAGIDADALYHFECARTALIAGSRPTALHHAVATIAAEPDRLYGYVTLFACAAPKPLLRFLLNLRARSR